MTPAAPTDPGLDSELVTALVRKFLGWGSGCRFAARAAKANKIKWLVRPDLVGVQEIVGGFFAGAAEESRAAGLIFPTLRSSTDVVAMLAALASSLSWRVSLVDWKFGKRREILVSVVWKTPDGNETSVMGLAPFGSMPSTRRAPFVSLIAWPGGRENEFRELEGASAPVVDGEVGFVDMASGATEEIYRASWKETRDEVKRLKRSLNEGAMRPDVTFCLSQRCGDALARFATSQPTAR